ncbi:hypothetical protein B0A48_10051 [Cryoendolithus antarcticus]|uniref:Zn(2)-C6 fungal-type domain-containing protein n=1 Tax=Cryoendolithus antarcticus TaxID=1507870 RepID=A0A1V8T3G4_9PEZI|nr:hypothetical protein B0A48_10051 [Cryoendolithus antarcticus]
MESSTSAQQDGPGQTAQGEGSAPSKSVVAAKPLRFVTHDGPPNPKRRRVGAACLTCRKRKTACSGERPACMTCMQNKLECSGYSSEGAVLPATTRRTNAEDAAIHPSLRREASATSSGASRPPQVQQQSHDAQYNAPAGYESQFAARLESRPAPATPSQQSTTQNGPMFSGPRNRVPYFRWLGPTAILSGYKQMVVKIKRHDNEGKTSTNGEAAGFVSPAQGTYGRALPSIGLDHSSSDPEASHSLDLPFYDTSSVPPSELITHLAQTFFVHLGCNYPFLQRERFLRDLEEKQVDAILVDAVCALSARFSTHELLVRQRGSDGNKLAPAEYGHAFAQRAMTALTQTFPVPTVAAAQAALLLAYNEFGESRDSGLWMYLGISIRIAQDLGLQKLEGLKYKGRDGPTPKQVKREARDGPAVALQSHASSSVPARRTVEAGQDDVVLNAEIEEAKAAEQERFDTFWAIFLLDRVVSSGVGRRSTLRDKDIELSFPPLDEQLPNSEWPAPFPALIRIVHLYGGVADLLNGIKEPTDVTPDTSKRLAVMERQVTSFYQGLSPKLHFDAVNFQYYVKAGEGTNFVLLHFWFHTLIVLLHQPTILKTFEGRMLHLFPNSQQLSMSSAKTIADILSYSQLMDAKASLGNPFTTQCIYVAACAFLKETAEQTASSNAQSRATSPIRQPGKVVATTAGFTPVAAQSTDSSITPANNDKRAQAKHTLLATAASQHYQLCYKALQSLETYWAGTKYILTILDQKFQGVDDPLLYTVEEGESAIEQPRPDPAFTSPGWRRKPSWGPYIGNPEIGKEFMQARAGDEGRELGNAIGWTLTGNMNEPSTNLAWHYASEQANQSTAAYNGSAAQQSTQELQHPSLYRQTPRPNPAPTPQTYGQPEVSDASLLLSLNNTYPNTNAASSQYAHDTATNTTYPSWSDHPHFPHSTYASLARPPFGDMMIESRDVDMSLLGLGGMPWFESVGQQSHQKFVARNQWLTDQALLQDARVQNKRVNAEFRHGLFDHSRPAKWNTRMDGMWTRYTATLIEAYGNQDSRGDVNSPPTGDTITLVLSTYASQSKGRDRGPDGAALPIMLGTLQTGFVALLAKFAVKYPGWKPTDLGQSVICNLITRLAKEGLVRTERSQRIRISLPLRSALTMMGFIAVALQPLGGHALRRGLAADMKDLGHEWTTGTGHRASLALGHNHMSERKGLTDYCADNTIAGLLNARAANLPMPKKQTSADMLQDLDSMTKRTAFTTQPLAPQDERDRAWLHMRARDDLKARDPTLNTGKLRTRAEEVALRMIKEAHASGLPPRMYLERSANSGLPSPNPPQLEGDEEPAAVDDMVEEDDSGLSVSVAEGELDAFLGSYNIGSGVSISNVIDKTVQDVDRLCDHVLEHGTQGTDWSSIHIELAQDDDECVAEPLEGVPHDALLMQAPQLIAFFTSYNIIRKPGKGAASIDLTHYRRLGKDEPKFMVFKCPKGCGVESQSLYYIEKLHECKRTKIVRPYVPRKVLEQPDKSGAMLLPQSLTGSNATPQQSFGLLNPPSVGAFTSGVLGAYQSPGSAYSPMPQVLSVPEQVHRSADAMGPTHTGPIKRPVMTGDSLGVTATGVDSGPPRKREKYEFI